MIRILLPIQRHPAIHISQDGRAPVATESGRVAKTLSLHDEARLVALSDWGSGAQLLPLSARSPPAIEAATERLAQEPDWHYGIDLAGAAHTLDVGRRDFAHRCFVVAGSAANAVEALRSPGCARAHMRALPAAEAMSVLLL